MRAGDIVWVYDPNHRPHRSSIEKVGRTRVFLKTERTPFDIETRTQKDGYGNTRFVTDAEHEARELRNRALAELRGIGVEVRAHDPQLHDIHRLLAPLIQRTADTKPLDHQEKKR